MFMRCDFQRWCDMFAGSGAIGLEALSRGAKEVVFIEHDRSAYQIVKNNIETCKMQSQSVLIQGDALFHVQNKEYGIFDVIFMDPPYDYDLRSLVDVLVRRPWYDKDTLFVLERRASEDMTWCEEHFMVIKQRKVGQSQYVVAKIRV